MRKSMTGTGARWRIFGRAAALAGLGMLLLTPGTTAHERWFAEHNGSPLRVEDVFSPVTILSLAVIAGAVGLAWCADRLIRRRRRQRPSLEQFGIKSLTNLYAWLPPILAIHAAVPLIVSGVELRLFAPNLPLPRTLAGGALALAQIVVALGFLYGAFTRFAAVGLAVIGLVGMLFVNPLFVLEHCDLLGIAAFLYIAGRGPFSVDALIGRVGHPRLHLLPYAVPALRILTGIAIIVLGFTEKLWNRQFSLEFLRENPLNFTRALPIGLSDEQFIIVAGLVEVAVGALIVSGLWTRFVILLAWLPFNLSIPFFGWVELAGHLPTYGTMTVLLIWGAGQDLTPYIRSVEAAEAQAEQASRAAPRVAA